MGVSNLSIVVDASQAVGPLKTVDGAAQKLNGTVNQTKSRIKDTNKGLRFFGRSARGAGAGAAAATPGVAGLGVAINSVLAPLAIFTTGAALAAKAVGELSGIDFNLRKWETLVGTSDDLHANLKEVSKELNASVSTAQLVAGAYDVASAGFTDAADAAMILKAAALGAKGGFSEMETTAGATVKVLNAYGLEAKDAAKLMDMFVQTQNDGIINVDQYAQNIGKVASVAAMLKIPLSEVNAAISLSTSTGVNAEVAFTGMKTALIKLTGSRGAKKLEKLGLDISAATIESEGLLATLKKLEGLDSKAIGDIFGAEAIQVMSPILNNLEKYEKFIKNQVVAVGTAEKAHDRMNQTIKGAWDEMTNVISNLFTDSTDLGELLKNTIQIATVGLKLTLALLDPAIKGLANISAILNEIVKAAQWLASKGADLMDRWGISQFLNQGEEKKKQIDPIGTWVKSLPWNQPQQVEQLPAAVNGSDPTAAQEKRDEGNKKNEDSLKKQNVLADQLNEHFKEIGRTIGEDLHYALKDLITGTQTLGESLANIAMKISDMLLDMAIQAGLKGALTGTSFGTFLGFANGGRPPVGKASIVGEKGPELFVPQQAGKIIPNDQLKSNSAPVNITVNVDASESNVSADQAGGAELGNLLAAAIQSEIVQQQRPGGLLA